MGSVTVASATQWRRYIANSPGTRRWGEESGRVTADRVRAEAPADTGDLRRSIDYRVTYGNEYGPKIIVGSPLEHAVYVHEGHGEIRPILPIQKIKTGPRRGQYRKSVLSWIDKGGQRVYAQRVRPVRENPYMWRALVYLYGPQRVVRFKAGKKPRLP